MDLALSIATGLVVVLLVQVVRTIGAFRLKFLTASLSDIAKATSRDEDRAQVEAKMQTLVKSMRSQSFVETYTSYSKLHLRLFITGSYAVLVGVILFGFVLVYTMIVGTGSLIVDSLVLMYVGLWQLYSDIVDNYLIMIVGILYFSIILWPVVYVYDRLGVAKGLLKGEPVVEPGPIDRYGLAFSGVAPVLFLLVVALIGYSISYGVDRSWYENEVAEALDSDALGAYVSAELDEPSLSDDTQRKLFIGVLMGSLLEATDEAARQSIDSVICEEFGPADDDVQFFLQAGFQESLRRGELTCGAAESMDELVPGLRALLGRGSSTYWQGVERVPDEANVLALGTPTRIDVEQFGEQWLSFVAPRTGNYTIRAEDAFSLVGSADPVMALYAAVDRELEFLEFNDDEDVGLLGGFDSRISIPLTAGVRYYVGVAEHDGDAGTLNVSVEFGF